MRFRKSSHQPRLLQVRQIPSSELKLEHIPSPEADVARIMEFALTYADSQIGGGVEPDATRSSLSFLRNELWIEHQRLKGDIHRLDPDQESRLRGLVGRIENYLITNTRITLVGSE